MLGVGGPDAFGLVGVVVRSAVLDPFPDEAVYSGAETTSFRNAGDESRRRERQRELLGRPR
jgi:hypothetical protein